MRPIRPILIVLVLHAAAVTTATDAAGQAATLVLGAAVGTESAAPAFAPCGGSWGSIHGRIAAERGLLSLEARGGRQVVTTMNDCARVPPSNGVHTFRAADVDEGTSLIAELRARAQIPTLLLHVGAGGGSLLDEGVAYGLVFAGMSTGGSIRISLDIEPHWYRIPVTRLEGEWQQGQLVDVISSERAHEWERSTAFRMSVGIPIN